MKIENTREIFFNNSKEQYLYFKKVWSQACNSDRVKKKIVEDAWGTGCFVREFGWLQREHYLLYALVCGKDVRRAFTPTTNATKLANGSVINNGLYTAYCRLRNLAKIAEMHIRLCEKPRMFNKDKVREVPRTLADFLEPFEGTITLESIILVMEHCPEIKALESSFGKGKQVAKDIIDGKITDADLWERLA